MEMTYHVAIERANRVQNIVEKIGIGQVIKEKYQRQDINKAGHYVCITDTGITLIKTEDKLKVITMYVTTQRELVAVFGGPRNVPNYLRKKVDYNQSKYIRHGKTIWR